MGLKQLCMVALLLNGCGASPAAVTARSAAYQAHDEAESMVQATTLAVVNGGIIDPTEPEGFATESLR